MLQNDLSYLRANSLSVYFHLISIILGNLGGERALVVGSGPSIHELTYLVPHYRQFVVSDIVESSLQAIRAWRDREPGAYEWAPFFKHYAARAGCG